MSPVTPSDPTQRFGCFLLHAHASRGVGEQGLHLVLEDVGTGTKLRFETADALGRYLNEWAAPAAGASDER